MTCFLPQITQRVIWLAVFGFVLSDLATMGMLLETPLMRFPLAPRAYGLMEYGREGAYVTAGMAAGAALAMAAGWGRLALLLHGMMMGMVARMILDETAKAMPLLASGELSTQTPVLEPGAWLLAGTLLLATALVIPAARLQPRSASCSPHEEVNPRHEG
jgi:hypothetical protein